MNEIKDPQLQHIFSETVRTDLYRKVHEQNQLIDELSKLDKDELILLKYFADTWFEQTGSGLFYAMENIELINNFWRTVIQVHESRH